MYLKSLKLWHFRNYTRLELSLPARIIVLQGENAQGKTNLLEAIYYLATTKSPLTSVDKQLIAWAAEREVIPYTRLEGVFCRGGEEHTIEITLTREQTSTGWGPPTSRRQIRLNGVPRRALDLVGMLNVVLFLPQDIALVSGAAGARRHYLDVTLCQIAPHYCQSLSRYNRVITQRNALLRQIRDHRARPSELSYWDEQLAQLGAQVQWHRYWAIGELRRHVAHVHPALTGGHERLELSYQNSVLHQVSEAGPPGDAELGTVSNQGEQVEHLSGVLARALGGARREEIARGVSIIGPHRDDVRLLANDVDITTYGSRGQQRTVALALKLAEVALMQECTGEMPILLLDDVVSELDQHRSQYLLGAITEAQQVLVTTTDLHDYPPDFLQSVAFWRVVAGTISEVRGL